MNIPMELWPLLWVLNLLFFSLSRNPSHLFLVLGGACNWLVMMANNRQMPVWGLEQAQGRYVPAGDFTKLGFLADRMSWPLGCSPGDVLLWIGVAGTLLWPLIIWLHQRSDSKVSYGGMVYTGSHA